MIFIFIALATFGLVYFMLRDKHIDAALVINFYRYHIKFFFNDVIIYSFFITALFYSAFGSPIFIVQNLIDMLIGNTNPPHTIMLHVPSFAEIRNDTKK